MSEDREPEESHFLVSTMLLIRGALWLALIPVVVVLVLVILDELGVL